MIHAYSRTGDYCGDCGALQYQAGVPHACTNRGRVYGYGPGDCIRLAGLPDELVVLEVERGGSAVVKVGPGTTWVPASLILRPESVGGAS